MPSSLSCIGWIQQLASIRVGRCRLWSGVLLHVRREDLLPLWAQGSFPSLSLPMTRSKWRLWKRYSPFCFFISAFSCSLGSKNSNLFCLLTNLKDALTKEVHIITYRWPWDLQVWGWMMASVTGRAGSGPALWPLTSLPQMEHSTVLTLTTAFTKWSTKSRSAALPLITVEHQANSVPSIFIYISAMHHSWLEKVSNGNTMIVVIMFLCLYCTHSSLWILNTGLAWSLNNKVMYYTDSLSHQIVTYDYDEQSGDISNKKTFAAIPESAGVPDGLTIDRYSFHWTPLDINSIKNQILSESSCCVVGFLKWGLHMVSSLEWL